MLPGLPATDNEYDGSLRWSAPTAAAGRRSCELTGREPGWLRYLTIDQPTLASMYLFSIYISSAHVLTQPRSTT